MRQRKCGNAIVKLARLRPIVTCLDEFRSEEFAGDSARALEIIAIGRLSQSVRRPPRYSRRRAGGWADCWFRETLIDTTVDSFDCPSKLEL